MKFILFLFLASACFGKDIENEFVRFNYDDSAWTLVKSYPDRMDYVFCLEESGKVYANLQILPGSHTIDELKATFLQTQGLFFEKFTLAEEKTKQFHTLILNGRQKGKKLFVRSTAHFYADKDFALILFCRLSQILR